MLTAQLTFFFGYIFVWSANSDNKTILVKVYYQSEIKFVKGMSKIIKELDVPGMN